MGAQSSRRAASTFRRFNKLESRAACFSAAYSAENLL
jgi:hypothetical protein